VPLRKPPEEITTEPLASHYAGEYGGLAVTSVALGSIAIYGGQQASQEILAVAGDVGGAALLVFGGIALKNSLLYAARARTLHQEDA